MAYTGTVTRLNATIRPGTWATVMIDESGSSPLHLFGQHPAPIGDHHLAFGAHRGIDQFGFFLGRRWPELRKSHRRATASTEIDRVDVLRPRRLDELDHG